MPFTNTDLPTPTETKDLLDPATPASQNSSGFQRAHIVGEAFADRAILSWFRWIMGPQAKSALRRASTACGSAPPLHTLSPRGFKSPHALGIASLDVHAQPLDATTPQGARLTGYGDVRFASGVVRRMLDAANKNECVQGAREAA